MQRGHESSSQLLKTTTIDNLRRVPAFVNDHCC
jgi:hypothetical protein